MEIEKIHRVRAHLTGDEANKPSQHPPPQGVVSLKVTRFLAFFIISMSVVACAVVGVLAVWQVVTEDLAWRSLASLGIVSLAVAIFVALNEGFGPAIRER